MTLGKPDEMPGLVRGLLAEIKPSTLLVALATCLGAYYGVTTQVTVVEQKQAEQARQIEAINTALVNVGDTKLNREVYETQVQANSTQLKGISDTVDRIEQFLMDHPRGSK